MIDQNLLQELRQKSVQHLKVKPEGGAPPDADESEPTASTITKSDSQSVPDVVDSIKNGVEKETPSMKSEFGSTNGDDRKSGSSKEDLFSVHNFDIGIDLFNTSAPSSELLSGLVVGP